MLSVDRAASRTATGATLRASRCLLGVLLLAIAAVLISVAPAAVAATTPAHGVRAQAACSYDRFPALRIGHHQTALAVGRSGHYGQSSPMPARTADAVSRFAAEDAGIPSRLARVTDADVAGSPTLGAPGSTSVFVTPAEDLEGIETSEGIAQRLTLVDDAGKLQEGPFAVTTFDTPEEGLASPVFRTNPGFVQGGFTAGGAREFVLPNLAYEDLGNVEQRIVP